MTEQNPPRRGRQRPAKRAARRAAAKAVPAPQLNAATPEPAAGTEPPPIAIDPPLDAGSPVPPVAPPASPEAAGTEPPPIDPPLDAGSPISPVVPPGSPKTEGGMLPPAWSLARIDTTQGYPALTESTDRMVHALQGRLTMGLSPAALTLAYLDWAVHYGHSFGKMTELGRNAAAKSLRFMLYALRSATQTEAIEPFIEPLEQDTRFSSKEWQKFPYNVFYQSFLLSEQWWHYATTGVRGVSPHHQQVVAFTARQLLDMLAPSNFPFTNPDVIKATVEQGGANLTRGAMKLMDDFERTLSGRSPAAAEEYKIGENLAITPGKVVYRNRLIELIQYTPTTPNVQAEPILIIPAWIMKYYILDLSPNNSLVKYLVDNGHTVFIVSWRNPTEEERELGMEEYRKLGVMEALDAVSAIVPERKIHTVGYCLGGTLLSISAATMARDGDDRLKSMTLLAAQTDFEEAGEIMLFIDESQVTFLEDLMWDQGVLDTKQMAGAFQLLRSNDLIWSRMVRHYLLGEPETMNDLMAWNADPTRMPYRMHSEYLRQLFLNNDFSKGRYTVGGRPVAITDIRAPICAVGTTKDHVAPWKSVYKIGILSDTDVTFILTSGGHNAGIVSEPGRARRTFQMATRRDQDRYMDPDTWLAITPKRQGSWWPAWRQWVLEHSSGETAPPPLGNATAGYPAAYDAPGHYVRMR